ncbi:MAG TPA: NAD(P)/FAD-dependent oxidoreductase [Thermoleophilaceae bacterium]|nr:NAD(P)/FAD-dependent oxidoreductase [Thermoleophilaceae bacterium]
MAHKADIVIVGGRCAGSVLALRLARAGARVVMIDREELGSDTLSTHALFPHAIARLDSLGVLAPLLERHEVPWSRYCMRVLGHEVIGTFTPVDGFDRMIAPRRPALDRVLGEAAIDAGVDARYGQKVTGLLGSGTDDDPVRGVRLDSGETIEAPVTVGADGRASSVARMLGLERTRPLAGDMAFLLGYWRGLPETDVLTLDTEADGGLSRFPCEDGVQLLLAAGPAELTRGGPEARKRAYHAMVRRFPATLDPGALDQAELVGPVRAAPETMLRGYFRRPSGPGWALVGDSAHFKHPSTAQGISDAIEAAVHVADAVIEGGDGLGGYEAWRDRRAAGQYELSYQLGTMPRPEVAGKIFAGIASEPGSGQLLRDTMTRRALPDQLFSGENMQRWFSV